MMLRLIRLLAAGLALAVVLFSALALHHRDGTLLLTVEPLQQARDLGRAGRWAEAKTLAEFVASHPHLGDPAEAARIARRADFHLRSFWGQADSFLRGAASGEPTDTASMLGSLSLDLFVVGDIRDLAVQGWREIRHGDGDTVILALSAVGLATSLAPNLDWAPAMLKAFRRVGALSGRFARQLGRLSRRSLHTLDFAPLSAVVTEVGKAARRLGPGPLRGAMASVETPADLTRISRAAAVNPQATYAVSNLLGSKGVRRISRDGRNIGVVAGSMKIGSRLAKLATKLSTLLPTLWLVVALITGSLLFLWLLWPRQRRAPAGDLPGGCPSPSPAPGR
jgi:hypothetical protein